MNSAGKFEPWPLWMAEDAAEPVLPASMVCNSSEILLHLARDGLGLIRLPDFMVRDAIAVGELVTVLDDFNRHRGSLRSKHLAPKLRAFIDFMSTELSSADGCSSGNVGQPSMRCGSGFNPTRLERRHQGGRTGNLPATDSGQIKLGFSSAAHAPRQCYERSVWGEQMDRVRALANPVRGRCVR